jgi:hypothetical protein
MGGFITFVLIGAIVKIIADFIIGQTMTAAQRQNILTEEKYGITNTAMTCPHCDAVGKIRTKNVKQKKGVSGGKATAAVLTGGLSLLAVGLSRKEGATQAHCDNCNNTWFF